VRLSGASRKLPISLSLKLKSQHAPVDASFHPQSWVKSRLRRKKALAPPCRRAASSPLVFPPVVQTLCNLSCRKSRRIFNPQLLLSSTCLRVLQKCLPSASTNVAPLKFRKRAPATFCSRAVF